MTQPTKGSRRRRTLSATRGESERLTVWLSVGLATRLRVYAARQRAAVSVVVEDAVERLLKTRKAE